MLLAEKTDQTAESVRADDAFRLLATMNPGGDYGKKELSPAMRNRFTEIWVPAAYERADLELIVRARLNQSMSDSVEESVREQAVLMTTPLLDFVEWFGVLVPRRRVSLRELLAWSHFSGVAVTKGLSVKEAFVHG